MAKEYISPSNVHPARTYTHVVKAGNTIYVSGQIGCDIDGNVVQGGFQAQAERVFENLSAVLEAAGATLKDIVKVTTYVRNMSDRPILTAVREKYFSAPYPASTLVEISSLALPDLLIEVEAIAVVE
jgi:reactive intermediate/imine deaminase